MPRPERNDLRQFLLFVFVLLVPCFALWTVASAWLATPAIGLVHLALSAWFPDIVNVVYQQGGDALLMTRFDEIDGQLVAAQDAQAGLGFRLNTGILSYSIPFYAALHFATEKKSYLADFVLGVIVLYPFIVLGLLCLCLKELMVNLGGVFLNQAAVFVPAPGVIGILYQLNILIIPPLAPVLLWAWQSRDTALFRAIVAYGGTADNTD